MAQRRVTHPEGGRVRTKQGDALDTDINKIINRFVAHLHAPDPNAPLPTYGDFSNIGDYHTALNKVTEAQTNFNALPSAVRDHVDNDPGEFLKLVFDPDRIGELEELGLVPEQTPAEPEEPAPTPAPPSPE